MTGPGYRGGFDDDDDNNAAAAPTNSDGAAGHSGHSVHPGHSGHSGHDDATVHPDFDHDPDYNPRTSAIVLTALSAGLGIVGMSIGFATVLGVTATATGGNDLSGFGPMVISAVSSLLLGVLLVGGAVLLWRAHRSSLAVIGAGVGLLALSSLARMVLDSLTFISVVGTVFSLFALVAMGYLIASDGVREHVREGVPLRLR